MQQALKALALLSATANAIELEKRAPAAWNPYIQFTTPMPIHVDYPEDTPFVEVQIGNNGGGYVSNIGLQCRWNGDIRVTGKTLSGPFGAPKLVTPDETNGTYAEGFALWNFGHAVTLKPYSHYAVGFELDLSLAKKGKEAGAITCHLLEGEAKVDGTSIATTGEHPVFVDYYDVAVAVVSHVNAPLYVTRDVKPYVFAQIENKGKAVAYNVSLVCGWNDKIRVTGKTIDSGGFGKEPTLYTPDQTAGTVNEGYAVFVWPYAIDLYPGVEFKNGFQLALDEATDEYFYGKAGDVACWLTSGYDLNAKRIATTGLEYVNVLPKLFIEINKEPLQYFRKDTPDVEVTVGYREDYEKYKANVGLVCGWTGKIRVTGATTNGPFGDDPELIPPSGTKGTVNEGFAVFVWPYAADLYLGEIDISFQLDLEQATSKDTKGEIGYVQCWLTDGPGVDAARVEKSGEAYVELLGEPFIDLVDEDIKATAYETPAVNVSIGSTLHEPLYDVGLVCGWNGFVRVVDPAEEHPIFGLPEFFAPGATEGTINEGFAVFVWPHTTTLLPDNGTIDFPAFELNMETAAAELKEGFAGDVICWLTQCSGVNTKRIARSHAVPVTVVDDYAVYEPVTYAIYDAETEKEVGPLKDGDEVNLCAVKYPNFQAKFTTYSGINNVYFELESPAMAKKVEHVEYLAPYYTFGDDAKGDVYAYDGGDLPEGDYTLKATVYYDNYQSQVAYAYTVAFKIAKKSGGAYGSTC